MMGNIKQFRLLVHLHYQLLKKNKLNHILLAVFLLAGLYGLFQGFASKTKLNTTLRAFTAEKELAVAKLQKGLLADTATASGKVAFEEASSVFSANWLVALPVCKYPSGTAIYHIGQSDVFSSYYSFKVESFIMQLFKQTEIVNPLRSLVGHFDVSFWITNLLPLLCILLCFNVLSAETDSGNWKLIYSQGVSAKLWLQSKFALVGLLLLLLLGIVAIAGSVVNYIYFQQLPGFRDLFYFIGAVCYLLLWLAILYYINALNRPTGFNALASGIGWIGICVLLPILISKAAQQFVPVDTKTISTFSRRPQNPAIEDSLPYAQSLILQFVKEQPAYSGADTSRLKPRLLTRTYYAFHSLLDMERWPLVQQYYSSVGQRQWLCNYSTFVNPAGSVDGWMGELADNDGPAYHHLAIASERFHHQLQGALYPALFFDRPLVLGDYKRLPHFVYEPQRISSGIVFAFLSLLLITALLVFAANKKLNRLYRVTDR